MNDYSTPEEIMDCTPEQKLAFEMLLEELRPYGVKWGLDHEQRRVVLTVNKPLPADLAELVDMAGPLFHRSARMMEKHFREGN